MRLTRTLPRSLAGQLFAMQVVLIAAVVAGCAVFAYVSGSAQAEETAARQVRVAALAVADSPSVREAIRTPDPSAVLQPYAERVREDTGIAFVTIMDTERVRWTHPDEEQIGDTFLGNTAKALRGQTFSETYTGTLGPSIRVVTPIRDDGRIVGLVSAGITVDRVSSQVRDQLGALALAAGGALALGGAGTYVINARLRRHTHGMNAAELSRLHDYHQATLHAVREGLLMLDGRRRIALVNDAGRELLGLEPDAEAVGRTVDELALPAPLTGALLASEARVDELHLTADRVVVVNTRPVVGGERRGTVVTLRDHTELQALTGELDSERGFTQALRSQAHEAANRLHTVVSLIELGRVEEAVDFATAELELAQVLTDRVVGAVEEPVLAALLLGKAAQANERGVELVLAEDSLIDDGALPASLAQRDLVTILGNLIDNAVEAASDGADGGSDDGSGAVHAPRAPGGPAGRARVTVTALADERELLLRVADTGAGIGPEAADEVFRRGWSTHGSGRGLGLALVRQAAYRNGGTVELDAGPDGGARFTVRLPLGDRTAAGVRAKEVTA
ncbi:Sensor histidine kinase regulating citrate/malate metabolism [Streptomyces sp. MnatMP-M77]|uniref:sensor histidine kinase n=1 Tax=unclassified Streptomyces TaxID=2593676 RepID=UPI000805CEEA|nr:sensor histidine kinase [Streptomyces sp. MnatMP-M77]MYT77190.1 PAS domain-containing protein [Streptomyces sp. SID8364]SBU89576.1 Sensor histidine kinase regulating citrate/malate metabolism [Streptomyces sp. MnatMP-M77]